MHGNEILLEATINVNPLSNCDQQNHEITVEIEKTLLENHILGMLLLI